MASAVTMSAKHPAIVNLQIDDIQRATTMLINLRPEDVREDHPFKFLCKKKLYVGTQLDREQENDNNILRKNMYYLARNTKNVTMLIIQLTQRAVFSLDQKEKMLSHPDVDLIRAVDMFSSLLTVQGNSLDRMMSVLENFENAHVADILRTAVTSAGFVIAAVPSQKANRLKVRMPRPGSIHKASSFAGVQRTVEVTEEAEDHHWTCPHCTFKNTIGETNICSICFKTRDILTWTDDAEEDVPCDPLEYDWIACSQCTLLNKFGEAFCQVCGLNLNQNVNDLNLLDDDSDDE